MGGGGERGACEGEEGGGGGQANPGMTEPPLLQGKAVPRARRQERKRRADDWPQIVWVDRCSM
jgi:hypothetical protein